MPNPRPLDRKRQPPRKFPISSPTSTRRSSPGIYISWPALPGKMQKEFTSINGLNKSAMKAVDVARGALLLVFVLLLSAADTLAQQTPSPPPDSIRVSVERVNVGVIVTDARGKFIEGLRRDDFHVF